MKTYGGVDVYTHVFLTLVLVGSEWSASCPGRFTLGVGDPVAHRIGGYLGPRADLDDEKKRKCLTLPGLELRIVSVNTDCIIASLRFWAVTTVIWCSLVHCFQRFGGARYLHLQVTLFICSATTPDTD
jgi:hypothetical protein